MPSRVKEIPHDSPQFNKTSEEQKNGANKSEVFKPKQGEIKNSDNSTKTGEEIKTDKQIDSMSDLKELKDMIFKLQAEVKAEKEENKAK